MKKTRFQAKNHEFLSVSAHEGKSSLLHCTPPHKDGNVFSRGKIPEIIRDLKNPLWKVRCAAVDRISEFSDAAEIRALILATENERIHIRDAIACGLSAQMDRRKADAICDVLSEAPWFLSDAVFMRLRSGFSIPVNIPASFLSHPDVSVRRDAAAALGYTGSDAAVDHLILSLSDPDLEVRRRGAWSLGKIGTARAAKALEHRIQDEEPRFRKTVIRALGICISDIKDEMNDSLQ